MSFGFVQFKSAGGSGSSVTGPSMTLTAGNTVVVAVLAGYGGANNTATSVTDGLGNTYNIVSGAHAYDSILFSGFCGDLFVCTNCLGGTTTLTGHFPASSGFNGIDILEYSGLATSSIVDTSGSNGAGTGTTATISLTTSFVDTLIVGWFERNDATVTSSSLTDRSGGAFAGQGVMGDQEKTPAGAVNVTCTASASGQWLGMAVALKIAGVSASSPVVVIMQ